ncbi:hypothetical protein [Merismopedia glauca]|uniref:Uncharacterized protein n=1 Tax=Merismopedia glauca CCAP 1448/3 TaxID=1296344 RepID=A0A2T1C9U0_9CYAN|nr:hypothetical protein [Merismopedia glauca]PSB05011.1 hypothetical protein C7B64_01220 [Merismopedia glauca CCAP 1448/3]
MAKLFIETAETIWSLKRQLLNMIDEATAAELMLFERFGETITTIIALDELKSVAEQARDKFLQLSNLQLRIAETQPNAQPDMLELVSRVSVHIQEKLPALKRSVQEIKSDWSLP